jgi:hypothetical protein
MSFENDLHDWFLDGIILAPPEVTLFVSFYGARKQIRLIDATRCLINNLLISNVIFEAKIISATDDPERYKEEVERLDETYPVIPLGMSPKICCISASLGANATIEFRDLEVTDL